MTLVRVFLATLATLARLIRPSRGLHSAPRVLRRDVQEEAKASRVRRYAAVPASPSPSGPGYASASAAPPVRIPSPRPPADDAPAVLVPVPADYVPVVNPEDVVEPACIVRGFYLAYEAEQAQARVDRSRLGLAVLTDLATTGTSVVTA